MMIFEAASKTLVGIREGAALLIKPFYWSVTWLLNRILGSFTLYVGIEYEEQPPDCGLYGDWISVMVTLLMFFIILAMIFFALESRLTPNPPRPPDPMKAEDGDPSRKVEL